VISKQIGRRREATVDPQGHDARGRVMVITLSHYLTVAAILFTLGSSASSSTGRTSSSF